MQKKLKSLLAVASLVAAVAVFFLACGEGQPMPFDGPEISEVEHVLDDNIKDGSIYNGYEPPPQEESSSSVAPPPPPSSSSQNNPTPSSAAEPVSSSSRSQTVSSSDSEPPPPSSSSQSTQQSSSSSRAQTVSSSSQASQTANGCGASNPKSGFTCDWNKTTNLAPDFKLTPTQTGKGDCEITWNYAKGDQNPVNEWQLLYDCYELSETDGIITEGSKTYALFAKLTCSDGVHINKCAHEVTAGAAPYLEGECKWSKTPTTTARGAVPSGVSLVDTDKICGSTKPPVVYKYDGGSKTWPAEGGPLPEAKTYEDVQATVACPNYSVVPTDCPALPVKAGADYQFTCTDGIAAANCSKSKQAVQNDECIDVEITWTNQYDHPTIKMICDGNFPQTGGTAPKASITIKVGSKDGVKVSDGNHVRNEVVIINTIPVSTTEVLGVCVSFASDQTPPATINCELGR